MNIVPDCVRFDCVATEKPANATTRSTPGVFSAISVARRMTSLVRSSDEPFGSSTMRDEVALVLRGDEAGRDDAEQHAGHRQHARRTP